MRWLKFPGDLLYYQLFQFMIGGKEPGVLEVIGRVAPRPLLLIASGQQDIYFNRQFYRAANEPRDSGTAGRRTWRSHPETRIHISNVWSSSSPGNCYRSRQAKFNP